ncbi:hypothetical protein OF001_U110004 [Pseudomonas sp. OF001]|nr:hypothetical protein OF001_U110004 [Pseudomonas sp. OF001]
MDYPIQRHPEVSDARKIPRHRKPLAAAAWPDPGAHRPRPRRHQPADCRAAGLPVRPRPGARRRAYPARRRGAGRIARLARSRLPAPAQRRQGPRHLPAAPRPRSAPARRLRAAPARARRHAWRRLRSGHRHRRRPVRAGSAAPQPAIPRPPARAGARRGLDAGAGVPGRAGAGGGGRRGRRAARRADDGDPDRRAPGAQLAGQPRPVLHLRAEDRPHRCLPQLHLQRAPGGPQLRHGRLPPAVPDARGLPPPALRRRSQGRGRGAEPGRRRPGQLPAARRALRFRVRRLVAFAGFAELRIIARRQRAATGPPGYSGTHETLADRPHADRLGAVLQPPAGRVRLQPGPRADGRPQAQRSRRRLLFAAGQCRPDAGQRFQRPRARRRARRLRLLLLQLLRPRRTAPAVRPRPVAAAAAPLAAPGEPRRTTRTPSHLAPGQSPRALISAHRRHRFPCGPASGGPASG